MAELTDTVRDGIGRHQPPNTDREADSAFYDVANPVVANRTIFIAAESRSGSTLLSQALWSSGVGGFPAEYFQTHRIHRFNRRWGIPKPDARSRLGDMRRVVADRGAVREYYGLQPGSVAPFLDRLVEQRTSDNGVFAVKTLWFDYQRVVIQNGLDHRYFPADTGDVKVIRLRRRDTVAQAISGAKARSTGRWHSSDRIAERAPTYSRGEIEERIVAIARSRDGWRDYFEHHKTEPLDLWYEDLVDDYDNVLREVFKHAGIDIPGPLPVAQLSRTADSVNEEWRERYEAGD